MSQSTSQSSNHVLSLTIHSVSKFVSQQANQAEFQPSSYNSVSLAVHLIFTFLGNSESVTGQPIVQYSIQPDCQKADQLVISLSVSQSACQLFRQLVNQAVRYQLVSQPVTETASQ